MDENKEIVSNNGELIKNKLQLKLFFTNSPLWLILNYKYSKSLTIRVCIYANIVNKGILFVYVHKLNNYVILYVVAIQSNCI